MKTFSRALSWPSMPSRLLQRNMQTQNAFGTTDRVELTSDQLQCASKTLTLATWLSRNVLSFSSAFHLCPRLSAHLQTSLHRCLLHHHSVFSDVQTLIYLYIYLFFPRQEYLRLKVQAMLQGL